MLRCLLLVLERLLIPRETILCTRDSQLHWGLLLPLWTPPPQRDFLKLIKDLFLTCTEDLSTCTDGPPICTGDFSVLKDLLLAWTQTFYLHQGRLSVIEGLACYLLWGASICIECRMTSYLYKHATKVWRHEIAWVEGIGIKLYSQNSHKLSQT